MPPTIRKPGVYMKTPVSDGYYLVFTRAMTCDEVGSTSNAGVVTQHFGGILGDDRDKTGLEVVVLYFSFFGVSFSGGSLRGNADGVNVSVVKSGPVNVRNTGRYPIKPEDDVYFLYPTDANTAVHKSSKPGVSSARVAIVVPGEVLLQISPKKCGYKIDKKTGMLVKRADRKTLHADMMLTASFIGTAKTGAPAGEVFLMILR